MIRIKNNHLSVSTYFQSLYIFTTKYLSIDSDYRLHSTLQLGASLQEVDHELESGSLWDIERGNQKRQQ